MTEQRKVAIVTGGGQGIGRAIVQRLLAGDWAVLAADTSDAALRELAGETTGKGELATAVTDVAHDENVRGLVALAREKWGGIDGLVNNAGIAIWNRLADATLDEWHQVLSVNLTGPFLCAKYAAPCLAERRGAIVNIASVRALASETAQVSYGYSASKGGLVSLTHALALDLGPAVRVNCISPGWIDVSGPRWKAGAPVPDALRDIDHQQHPAGRVGTPEDVAAMAAWLLGPEAGWVTGQNFIVDGGMTKKLGYMD